CQRGARVLRRELPHVRSALGQVRPALSTGRRPRRLTGRTDQHILFRHQPQDRQGTWPEDPAVGADAGGRDGPMISRRGFVATLTGGLLVAPLAAGAQQTGKIARVGILLFGTPDTDPSLPSFHAGLHALGYAEGRNILLEYRYAEGKPDRLPGLARELA